MNIEDFETLMPPDWHLVAEQYGFPAYALDLSDVPLHRAIALVNFMREQLRAEREN